ncbi:hypothetical protein GCM10017711_17890 [Paeniglutamicibacter sulfureus]
MEALIHIRKLRDPCGDLPDHAPGEIPELRRGGHDRQTGRFRGVRLGTARRKQECAARQQGNWIGGDSFHHGSSIWFASVGDPLGRHLQTILIIILVNKSGASHSRTLRIRHTQGNTSGTLFPADIVNEVTEYAVDRTKAAQTGNHFQPRKQVSCDSPE